MEQRAAKKSDTPFYIVAIAFGILAGIAHVAIGDALVTSLLVLIVTMFLGYMRPVKAWRWVLLVGAMVPLTMVAARLLHYYSTFSRAGIYGSILMVLPGFAGAYGGYFGRKFMSEVFLPEMRRTKK